MKKPKIAVIGGTGFEKLFKDKSQIRVGTPYGLPPPLTVGEVAGKNVVFLPRHGPEHDTPPHKVNYRANIYGLHMLGVERIIAINAVGAINRRIKPSDIIIPHDYVDFTKGRPATFYDESPVTHIDVSQPYCPEMRRLLIQAAEKLSLSLHAKAILVCTDGPRFETPAEIEMFRRLGFDIVGMTGVPEAVLARELEICYAALCFASNMAAGIEKRLSATEVLNVSREVQPKIEQIIIETIKALPLDRKDRCPCKGALKNARFN